MLRAAEVAVVTPRCTPGALSEPIRTTNPRSVVPNGSPGSVIVCVIRPSATSTSWTVTPGAVPSPALDDTVHTRPGVDDGKIASAPPSSTTDEPRALYAWP